MSHNPLTLALYATAASPVTDDPLVGDIARLYKTNRELHDKTAREWVQRFAK